MNKANPDALLELAERERQLRESIIHGLRMQGWSRMDAEDEALTRIEKFRAREVLNDQG